MGDLDGKVAIITGAGNGLGREHALYLGAMGARLVVNELGGSPEGEAAAKLFHPHEYAYLRPRGSGRSDLVLQLVNPPPERACSYDDNRVNLPVTGLATRIELPSGLKARGVYAATAEPSLRQVALDFSQKGRRLAFTVPEVRRLLSKLIWNRPATPTAVLNWSTWRRRHQARARRFHYATRGALP